MRVFLYLRSTLISLPGRRQHPSSGRFHWTLLIAVLWLGVTPCAASDVAGIVLVRDAEPENRGAAGVRVILQAVGGGIHQASADATGSYRIADVPPGTYRIRIDAPGFRSEALRDLVVGAEGTVSRSMDLYVEVKDDPSLPRVLLIGDSISNGYTSTVRQLLQGKANVHRIPASVGTQDLLAHIDEWLGAGRWDVIHFNCGLHDFAFSERERNLHRVPAPAYAENLKTIVRKLKATGAALIWASTTPVPEGDRAGRRNKDALEFNRIAAKIMTENGVRINDLYSVVAAAHGGLQRPANVHFTPEGSQYLGKQVAASVENALTKTDSRSRKTG